VPLDGVAVRRHDDQLCGRACALNIHAVSQSQKALGSLIDGLAAAELDLDRQPLPGGRLDNRIDLKSRVVPIVVDLGIVARGIDAQVAHHQRLK